VSVTIPKAGKEDLRCDRNPDDCGLGRRSARGKAVGPGRHDGQLAAWMHEKAHESVEMRSQVSVEDRLGVEVVVHEGSACH
jgi:hypothetical protein